VLLAITAASNENSEYSATSRTLLNAVARDLDIGRRIAAYRRIIAIADAISPHDHVPRAERVDGIAVLPGTAGAGLESSMRLSATRVAVIADRGAQISMPLSLVPKIGCRETIRPRASNDTTPWSRFRQDIAADVARNLLQPDSIAAVPVFRNR